MALAGIEPATIREKYTKTLTPSYDGKALPLSYNAPQKSRDAVNVPASRKEIAKHRSFFVAIAFSRPFV